MPDFAYPSNAELSEVEQDLIPRLEAGRVIFQIMPVENVEDDLVIWEQRDNFTGLQTVRGINGAPGRVASVGGKRWMITPGYYGEFRELNEIDLTRRRRFGTFGDRIDVSDLVMDAQLQLLERELDLQEYVGWTLLTTGTFSVANGPGTVLHTDTFSLQTYSSAVHWSDKTNGTPLADLRALKLLHRGHSVDLGRNATLYVNQTTLNDMLQNNNPADLGGKKLPIGASVLSLEDANKILAANDLPQVMAMDQGYIDDTGTFQLFIANTKGVLVGKRMSGAPVASYCKTFNANNEGGGAGSYVKVVDNGEREVPRRIAVHRGHNGAPKIPFPASLVRCVF